MRTLEFILALKRSARLHDQLLNSLLTDRITPRSGNGEIATDYDSMAELWHLMGLHLMVVDFRGYGWSTTDEPTRVSTLLSDSEALLGGDGADDASGGGVEAALRACGLLHDRKLPVVLFGRSMGSLCAIHLAAYAPNRFAGLVVESGIASGKLLRDGRGQEGIEKHFPRPPGGVEQIGVMENQDKVRCGCVLLVPVP